MRSHWRYRLAGLAIAAALAAGPASLLAGSHALAATTVGGVICPQGTHWDDTLHACK